MPSPKVDAVHPLGRGIEAPRTRLGCTDAHAISATPTLKHIWRTRHPHRHHTPKSAQTTEDNSAMVVATYFGSVRSACAREKRRQYGMNPPHRPLSNTGETWRRHGRNYSQSERATAADLLAAPRALLPSPPSLQSFKLRPKAAGRSSPTFLSPSFISHSFLHRLCFIKIEPVRDSRNSAGCA